MDSIVNFSTALYVKVGIPVIQKIQTLDKYELDCGRQHVCRRISKYFYKIRQKSYQFLFPLKINQVYIYIYI